MNWGTLGHSKEIEPLLVKLYDTHRTYQLAETQSPESRAELAHLVSGLLGVGLKQTERELVADILINLMRQAEKDLRHALAERISTMENAPLRLVLFMAQDEIGIAETVLRSSPVLNDLDLLYIIQSRDAEYWRAIAHRHQLNEPVVDALADTRDVPTACTLAENTDIHLTPYAVQIMSEVAQQGAEELARPLLSRSEIPEAVARKLYEMVGKEIEKTISNSLSNELSVLESVRDILVEFSEGPQAEYMPTPAMIKAAEMFSARGQLTTELMLKTLKRGQTNSFIAQISVLSGIKASRIPEIFRHDNGLAVIARGIAMTREEFSGAYLMTAKLRTGSEKISSTDFKAAITYFDTVSDDHVRKVFTGYRI